VTHAPYFFTDRSLISPAEVSIEGSDARHLAVVRRAQIGDSITVSDGAGRVIEARIVSAAPTRIRAEIVSEKKLDRSPPHLTVFQGLAKGEKVDLAVQKLVEIGVDEIVVVRAGRTVPRWDTKKIDQARVRWTGIAREAAKQSRQPWLPSVLGPIHIEEAAALLDGRLPALLAVPGAHRPLGSAIPETVPEQMSLIIGPEGGLTEDEIAVFVGRGAVPVSLGSQILRTETASLIVAAIVLHRFGRLA
jgi:16S rRNA (uracil1498-N3)-methyltransferase